MAQIRTPVEQHRYHVNGVTLHVVQAGPAHGPLVLLLHGFPEFWRGWAQQIDALAHAGFRVWIPDQRGYNLSDKPASVRAYSPDVLVEDVRQLIAQTGRSRVFLCGHDWGGAVAWELAYRHPELIERMVICNCPHPAVMKQHLRSSPRQMLKSWYMMFFQLPRVPEFWLSRNNFRALSEALMKTSKPGAFDAEELELYRKAWRQPGALTASIHWYRALFRSMHRQPQTGRIRVLTLLLWGTKDTALDRSLAHPSIAQCDQGRLVELEECTHWLLHEAPERIDAELVAFLR